MHSRGWWVALCASIASGGFAGHSDVLAGTLAGSKHDLTVLDERAGTGVMVGMAFDNYGSACVYCHTSHVPPRDPAGPPLWNRAYPVSVFTPYQSPTVDSPTRQPDGISLACLSCHDGSLAIDRIAKKPATFDAGASRSLHMRMGRGQDMENCGQCHRVGAQKLPGVHEIGIAAFGQNLNDDHPVSIDYPAHREDPKFRRLPDDGVFSNGVRLFAGRVECASCHDVHDPDNRPFLRHSVRGSALCVTCHEK